MLAIEKYCGNTKDRKVLHYYAYIIAFLRLNTGYNMTLQKAIKMITTQ